MLLEEDEVQKVLEQVEAAFPSFHDWRYINEKHNDYFGFAVWGRFVMNNEHQSSAWSRNYFITFDMYEKNWLGHLSIGQHWYLWSSADYGDAGLLDTKFCTTLEQAIAALKAEMASLFKTFSAP